MREELRLDCVCGRRFVGLGPEQVFEPPWPFQTVPGRDWRCVSVEHDRHLLADQSGLRVPTLDRRFGQRPRFTDPELLEPQPTPSGLYRGADHVRCLFETTLLVGVRPCQIAHDRECESTTCIDVWNTAKDRARYYGTSDLFRLHPRMVSYETGTHIPALMARDEHDEDEGPMCPDCLRKQWEHLMLPFPTAAGALLSCNADLPIPEHLRNQYNQY